MLHCFKMIPLETAVTLTQTCRQIFVVAMALFAMNRLAEAQDMASFEVHEWSVWMGEPQATGVNALAGYISAMPGLVETDRTRRRDSAKGAPSPMTPLSVMTLYGPPPEVVDIDLKIPAGRPIAQWPKSEGKSNRLRWLDLKVAREMANEESLAVIPEGHWFHRARELGGLYLQLRKGGRIERFLTYDLELQSSLPVRVDGGKDQYKIANIGKHKLLDLCLVVPDENGYRVGWLDVANPSEGGGQNPPAAQQPQPSGNTPAGSPAPPKETVTDIVLSDRLGSDTAEFQQKTTGELRRRLGGTGLTSAEIELLISLYEKHFFETQEIHLIYRLSNEALEEITPLAVEPDTAKIKRVGLMVARKVDPRLREDVQKLITDLGDVNYVTREHAEKRLKELGRLAIPSLKEALKNKDLEVVMRSERLLLGLKEQLGAE